MRAKTIDAIKAHAVAVYPEESCGLVIKQGKKEVYQPCDNVHPEPKEGFRIRDNDYGVAMETGEVLAVVHSHPDASNKPSEGDLVMIEEMQIPWLIVSVYKDLLDGGKVVAGDVLKIDPSEYEAPLEGRMFYHGVLDCYTLVRDYYKRVLSQELPNFDREDGWWEDMKGPNLYLENFEKAGFTTVPGGLRDIQEHDVVLMEIQTSKPVNGPNHAAIYVGDGKILHHLHGRLSSKDVYGGYWQNVTRCVIRHKEFWK